MFRNSVVLCLLPVAAMAQLPSGQQIMSGSGTLKSGVTIRFKTIAAPAGIDWSGLGEGGIATDANSIHRVMIDKVRGIFFGYDLAVGNGDALTGYVATFQPLSNSAPLLGRSSGGAILTQAPDPKFPAPQVLRDGDVIVLDLMVSPDGKQKVADYIEFLAHEPDPAAPAANAEPRDFTLDDGPVTFHAERVSVWIGGQKYSGMPGFTGKPGATFWVAFPGQGRYILSLIPHDGFIKSGAVRDNVISFQDNGREYEVRFMGPIAGAGKAWNLYVLHDPVYTPNPNQRMAVSTGTDRLENPLPKR